MTMPAFRGVPLDRLRIDVIEWDEGSSWHIKNRTRRKLGQDERDIDPTWATEAALDPNRIVAVANPLPGRARPPALLVVGKAESVELVLKVWILPKEPDGLRTGEWLGRSAAEATGAMKERYLKEVSGKWKAQDRKT
jgi:hypothetical protein